MQGVKGFPGCANDEKNVPRRQNRNLGSHMEEACFEKDDDDAEDGGDHCY